MFKVFTFLLLKICAIIRTEELHTIQPSSGFIANSDYISNKYIPLTSGLEKRNYESFVPDSKNDSIIISDIDIGSLALSFDNKSTFSKRTVSNGPLFRTMTVKLQRKLTQAEHEMIIDTGSGVSWIKPNHCQGEECYSESTELFFDSCPGKKEFYYLDGTVVTAQCGSIPYLYPSPAYIRLGLNMTVGVASNVNRDLGADGVFGLNFANFASFDRTTYLNDLRARYNPNMETVYVYFCGKNQEEAVFHGDRYYPKTSPIEHDWIPLISDTEWMVRMNQIVLFNQTLATEDPAIMDTGSDLIYVSVKLAFDIYSLIGKYSGPLPLYLERSNIFLLPCSLHQSSIDLNLYFKDKAYPLPLKNLIYADVSHILPDYCVGGIQPIIFPDSINRIIVGNILYTKYYLFLDWYDKQISLMDESVVKTFLYNTYGRYKLFQNKS